MRDPKRVTHLWAVAQRAGHGGRLGGGGGGGGGDLHPHLVEALPEVEHLYAAALALAAARPGVDLVDGVAGGAAGLPVKVVARDEHGVVGETPAQKDI